MKLLLHFHLPTGQGKSSQSVNRTVVSAQKVVLCRFSMRKCFVLILHVQSSRRILNFSTFLIWFVSTISPTVTHFRDWKTFCVVITLCETFWACVIFTTNLIFSLISVVSCTITNLCLFNTNTWNRHWKPHGTTKSSKNIAFSVCLHFYGQPQIQEVLRKFIAYYEKTHKSPYLKCVCCPKKNTLIHLFLANALHPLFTVLRIFVWFIIAIIYCITQFSLKYIYAPVISFAFPFFTEAFAKWIIWPVLTDTGISITNIFQGENCLAHITNRSSWKET